MAKKRDSAPSRIAAGPMLFVGGELCDGVTAAWVATLSRKRAYRIALRSYRETWWPATDAYSAMVADGLIHDVDICQDIIISERVGRGLELLNDRWPLAVRRAYLKAEREHAHT